MSEIGWIILCVFLSLAMGGLTGFLVLWNKFEGVNQRIDAMVKGREKFYKSLADPDVILADMERGAVAMEALAAKRHRNVREDAGPHAKIYRPKRLGRLPK